jgi:16S rRNA (uracil1498-N3)-methyltransferase
MSAPRFFVDLPLSAGAQVQLPTPVAHHAWRVLRLGEGASITLFNGTGGEYGAVLGDAQRMLALVGAHATVERESPLDLTLVQALVATEKLDLIVEKATELGAARVVLLPAARSVVRLSGERLQRRLMHLAAVTRAACEQCGRNRVPSVSAVASFEQAAAAAPMDALRLLLTPSVAPVARPETLPGACAFVVAIGPEGGFTADEIAQAQAGGYRLMTLGPRVLRTETAGLAMLATLQGLHGDFGAQALT